MDNACAGLAAALSRLLLGCADGPQDHSIRGVLDAPDFTRGRLLSEFTPHQTYFTAN